MVQNSRKVRGRRTEHVVANYFAEVWGSAKAVNSGASGSDVLGTPFDIEVKARAAFQPKAWIDQQKRRDEGKLKFVVMRCNGQGENPEDYVFIARLGDMMPLLEDKVPSEAIVRCKGCGSWTTTTRSGRSSRSQALERVEAASTPIERADKPPTTSASRDLSKPSRRPITWWSEP